MTALALIFFRGKKRLEMGLAPQAVIIRVDPLAVELKMFRIVTVLDVNGLNAQFPGPVHVVFFWSLPNQ